MAPDLDPGVEQRIASPDEGTEVRLILGVETTSDEVKERLENAGVTVHDELPLDYYAVSTTEDQLEVLCELDVVTSIEIDTEGKILETDFLSRRG